MNTKGNDINILMIIIMNVIQKKKNVKKIVKHV